MQVVESPVRRLAYLGTDRLAILAGSRPGRFYLFYGNALMAQADTVASPTFAGRGVGPNQILVLNQAGDLRYHDANNARTWGQAQTALRPGMVKSPGLRLALLQDGMGVAVSDANQEGIHLWNGNPSLVRFEELDGKVECMASDPAGVLAAATEEKRIHFAKIHDGTPQASPYQGAKGDVKQMAFSPDGKRLAVAYGDGTLAVLGFLPPRPEELRTNDKEEAGKWLEMLTVPVSGERGLEFGPDGKTLVALGARGVVVLGAWK
jgi:WD40 repeat protein